MLVPVPANAVLFNQRIHKPASDYKFFVGAVPGYPGHFGDLYVTPKDQEKGNDSCPAPSLSES